MWFELGIAALLGASGMFATWSLCDLRKWESDRVDRAVYVAVWEVHKDLIDLARVDRINSSIRVLSRQATTSERGLACRKPRR